MGKSRMMGAAHASSSLYKCDTNIPTGGGNKKQGITSRVGLNNWENREVQTQSNGRGRFKLFVMNQLGGVEPGHSMFGGRYNRSDGLIMNLYSQLHEYSQLEEMDYKTGIYRNTQSLPDGGSIVRLTSRRVGASPCNVTLSSPNSGEMFSIVFKMSGCDVVNGDYTSNMTINGALYSNVDYQIQPSNGKKVLRINTFNTPGTINSLQFTKNNVTFKYPV